MKMVLKERQGVRLLHLSLQMGNISSQQETTQMCMSGTILARAQLLPNQRMFHLMSALFLTTHQLLYLGVSLFQKGSATWPEETLPDSSQMAVSPPMGRSECKLLAGACHNSCSSSTWGLVIVTAGHDGRLRTYQNYGLPIRV
ncbi:hypothetical protein RHGRI_022361 [Rhododendron griersonianum]|uniref:Uncharacterized protein n=1 Tax=Rhododendron griersonianum TaxID=479676 RepID=A0AAV6J0E6_9ERIC|nr:hypothetical protein RHGRI_022361 [Rhododendron griersonianum]